MTYDTSIQYQAIELTLTIAYALIPFLVTATLLYIRVGPYKYGCGKRMPAGEMRPHHTHEHYWYRWLIIPKQWMPTAAWSFLLLAVWALWGTGWGLFGWIVNDFNNVTTSSMFWLTVMSFMIIVPVMAILWAVMFFGHHYLGWALIFSVTTIAASIVQFAMTIAYAVIYPNNTSSNVTYQWLAFAFATPQLLFYGYVLWMNVAIYMKNKDRNMEDDLAPDEDEAERGGVAGRLTELSNIMGQAIVNSDNMLRERHGGGSSLRSQLEARGL